MKENRLVYIAFAIIVMAFLFSSCNQNKEKVKIAQLHFKVETDSISNPQIKFLDASGSLKMLDIKRFNDTVFLFIIPDFQDSLSLFTFYWKQGFKFLRKRYFSYKDNDSLLAGGLVSMSVINSDTIIIEGKTAINAYDFSKGEIFYSFKWLETELFLANNSPIQWSASQKTFFSEYYDYSMPDDSLGMVKSEIYAGKNLGSKSLFKVPIFVPTLKEALGLNSNHHFSLSEHGLICKQSILNEFQVYDFKTKKVNNVSIPYFEQIIDTKKTSTFENYDKARDDYMFSYIQQGLCYDPDTKRTILIYLKPLPERDDRGMKPKFGQQRTVCYVFDAELHILGEIILTGESFWPSMCFAFKGEIYLVDVSDKIKVKKITYEI